LIRQGAIVDRQDCKGVFQMTAELAIFSNDLTLEETHILNSICTTDNINIDYMDNR